MRVLMLGWEFPPFISGGLGTACYGLTKALSRHQTDVVFVLPKSVDTDYTSHVKLLSPQAPAAAHGDRGPASVASTYVIEQMTGNPAPRHVASPGELSHVTFKAVPSRLLSPYQAAESTAGGAARGHREAADPDRPISVLRGPGSETVTHGGGTASAGEHYHGDLIQETRRYAQLCVHLAAGEAFDVIHAHDWMTFPAGVAVAAVTGKPLVVHVHSTEFDRAGENIHQQIYDIERRGMHSAMRIIAVSHLTRNIIQHRYGIEPDKVRVVYNGVENGNAQPPHPRTAIRRGEKIVLFLGRITMQKGPEYFVGAAKRVLSKYENVKFVMAGSGDKIHEIIELAAREGIGHKVLFTGFLRGRDVERIFKMADVYVMPSVSEPFGIAPLEAISHDVPVIISKTSGVSEVLTNALKVDFWDTDEIANKIIAVLRHPPLSSTLREHAEPHARVMGQTSAARPVVFFPTLRAYHALRNTHGVAAV